MIQKLIKIILLFLTLTLGLNVVMADSSGLNVVLANQNPDPVVPGNFVYLNVIISNSASDAANDVKIEMLENQYFSIATGSEKEKLLGVIPANSASIGSTSYVISKFKVLVDDSTPLGLNTIDFKVTSSQRTYNYEFDVLVQDTNPQILVNDIKIKTLNAGTSSKLSIEVENTNSIDLKNVVLSLDLKSVESTALSVDTGSNEKLISLLKAGEKKIFEFNLAANPDASSKPYLLPIEITYKDSLGNSYTSNVVGSVKVYSKPIISLKLDSQEIYSTGSGKITFAIANPSISSVKGTQIEIMPSKDYEVIEGESQYIGDLNPDDFQTIQSEIYIKNNQLKTINLKITYLDSYNVENEELVSIPIKVYTQEELNTFGIKSSALSSSKTSSTTYIVFFILLVIIFFVGKRIGFNKVKKGK